MKLKICFGFFMMLWMFSLSSMSSFSYIVEKITFEELVKKADYIILGAVKGNIRHIEERSENREDFYVHVDILVEKIIKAPEQTSSGSNDERKEEPLPILKKGSFITLQHPDPNKIHGSLRFHDKERAIWFLKLYPGKINYFHVLGSHQGRFLIHNNIVYKNITYDKDIGQEKYKQGTLKDFLNQIKAAMDALKKQDTTESSK